MMTKGDWFPAFLAKSEDVGKMHAFLRTMSSNMINRPDLFTNKEWAVKIDKFLREMENNNE